MRIIISILFAFIVSVKISYSQEQKEMICITDSLHNMATNLFNIDRDGKNALILEKYVLTLLSSTNCTDSLKYYNCVRNLATFNSDQGNTEAAIKYYKESLKYCSNIFGKDVLIFHTQQSELGYLLLETNIEKGKSLIQNSILKIDKEKYPVEHALSLINYSWYHFYSDSVSNARKYALDAVELLKPYRNTEEYSYALHQVAFYSYHLNDFEFAIPFQEECVKIRESLFGTRHNYYLNSLHLLSALYDEIGDIKKSIQIYKQILITYEALSGKNNVDYSCALNSLCEAYTSIGDYLNALPLAKEALSIDLELSKRNEYDRLDVSYNNVAFCYNHLGLNDSTLLYATKSLNTTLKKFGEHSRELIVPYNNLVCYALENHNVELARQYIDKSLYICGLDTQSNQHLLAVTKNIESSVYAAENDYENAIICAEYANMALAKLIGRNNEDYINTIERLIEYNFQLGNHIKTEEYLCEYLEHVRSSILKDFLLLPPIKRIKFWEMHEKMLCNDIIKYALEIKSNRMALIAYDATLISKGLLLSTEQSIKEIAENSEDPITIKTALRLEELCQIYNENISFNNSNNIKTIHSAEDEILSCYDELMKRSNILSRVLEQYKITSIDVKNKLKSNMTAIEFASIKENDDNQLLVALICTQKDDFKIIPLCRESTLLDYNADNQMHDKIFSQIWFPIISQINDIDTICFSPNGILYSIGIEHINIPDGGSIGKAFKIYRLSSTRELVINKRDNKLIVAAIYGGLDYDNIEDRVLTNNIESSNISFLWDVGQKKYLKGTSIEYNNILKSISQLEGIRVLGYTGINGTEISFRNLSNSKPNLIHLATHGFYNTIEDIQRRNADFNISHNQLSLSRSGLMLSGANQLFKDKSNYQENDGILTSQEISELNLGHADLVVLSACESGLGDVTNDGVWGLQRGFKKAGVNSIIMTLWEIDDTATSLFMSEFYRNYFRDYNKHSSLISAQKYLQQYSKEYAHPYYWAGFILLDGLN